MLFFTLFSSFFKFSKVKKKIKERRKRIGNMYLITAEHS